MERLTKKKIDIEKFSERTKSRLTQEYLDMAELNNKLCEYEDFMEDNNFHNFQGLKDTLYQANMELYSMRKTQQENQALQDKWQKLKEWVIKELGYASMYQEVRMDTLDEVKDKMQELEKNDE